MEWFYVIRISDYRFLYLGKDRKQAVAANVKGTFMAEGKNLGEVMRKATMAVGYIRRGLPPPDEQRAPTA